MITDGTCTALACCDGAALEAGRRFFFFLFVFWVGSAILLKHRIGWERLPLSRSCTHECFASQLDSQVAFTTIMNNGWASAQGQNCQGISSLALKKSRQTAEILRDINFWWVPFILTVFFLQRWKGLQGDVMGGLCWKPECRVGCPATHAGFSSCRNAP